MEIHSGWACQDDLGPVTGEVIGVQHRAMRHRRAGCGLVQLTSDKRRADAIRFYESLGFESSHEGLKLSL